VGSSRVCSNKAEGCKGVSKVESSSQVIGSLTKGIHSEVEYEDGSGTSLNGCLKVGMFLGFFSGQKKEFCFVDKVGGGGVLELIWYHWRMSREKEYELNGVESNNDLLALCGEEFKGSEPLRRLL